ncbi:MAG: UDP-3-O-[3-hydroxymyristoyl] N-acetylglucosamine deacetylase [Alphaproteobacteria bacterium]|nr:UDP-3-O-[3-hydroxymyristoyl] N-acetylglucosamine deacetylase [Alphaproteobacteria bacterium]
MVSPEQRGYDLQQRTLARAVEFSGISVHSGLAARIFVAPAAADSGIVFITARHVRISAYVAHICFDPAGLCTVIGAGGDTVSTVEHLMAAFAACGIDNAEVTLEGAELPILDGSAQPFIDKMLDAGLVAQQQQRRFLRITRPFSYQGLDGQWVRFDPIRADEEGTLAVKIDFTAMIPAIGVQSLNMPIQLGALRSEIMHCRTFGLEAKRQEYQAYGRGLGASCANAVLYDGDRVLNKDGLRCDDESVRHKALDLIGDLFLAGWPLLGHISAFKPGHRTNAEALAALLESDCYTL